MMCKTTDAQDLKFKRDEKRLHLITSLYQRDACGRGFCDTIVPITNPVVLVVASLRLLSSVLCAIPFLFSDLTCFITETVFQTSSAIFV